MLLQQALLPLLLPPSISPRLACPRCEAAGGADTKLVRAQSLEAELALAVSKEAYEEAATLRDELATLGMESELGVLQANAEFYRCFTDSDAKAMRNLWAQDGLVTCTHPGHAPMTGWSSVIASWEQIFSGDSEMKIEADDIHCEVQGNLAYVTCKELITPGSGKMAAVNVFRRQGDDSWRMVVHHAGPIMV